MKKSQNMMVWLMKNGFGSPIVAEFAVAGERCSNIVHLQKRV
jgi:hypothetical protein